MLFVPDSLIRHSRHGGSELMRHHLIFSQQLRTESARWPSVFLFPDGCLDLQLLFQTQFFWFLGGMHTSGCLFFLFIMKNNGIRMPNVCIWDVYFCFLYCSMRKRSVFNGICLLSEPYLSLSFVYFITSAIFSVNEQTLPMWMVLYRDRE